MVPQKPIALCDAIPHCAELLPGIDRQVGQGFDDHGPIRRGGFALTHLLRMLGKDIVNTPFETAFLICSEGCVVATPVSLLTRQHGLVEADDMSNVVVAATEPEVRDLFVKITGLVF